MIGGLYVVSPLRWKWSMMADWTSVSRIVPPARTRSAISPKARSNAEHVNLLGVAVHLPLLVIPGRLELLDQVARGDDLDAEVADQLDYPGIHARHVRVGDPGRILHRDATAVLHHVRNAGLQLLPGEVHRLRARQLVERADSMRWTSLRGSPLTGMK